MEPSGPPPALRPLRVVVVVGALGALLVLVAVAPGRRVSAGYLTAEEVVEDAPALYGKSVRLRDRVARVLGAQALTLGRGEGGEEVLVLSIAVVPALEDMGDPDGDPVGDVAAVEGRLHRFEIAALEASVGNLDDARYHQFEGRPVVLAEHVEPAPRER